ncbi:hypothetical protein V8B97DRAFT_1965658 [Scleroderma yunnanense]
MVSGGFHTLSFCLWVWCYSQCWLDKVLSTILSSFTFADALANILLRLQARQYHTTHIGIQGLRLRRPFQVFLYSKSQVLPPYCTPISASASAPMSASRWMASCWGGGHEATNWPR